MQCCSLLGIFMTHTWHKTGEQWLTKATQKQGGINKSIAVEDNSTYADICQRYYCPFWTLL